MGYSSQGFGELTLSRSLQWSEFEYSKFVDPEEDTILLLRYEEHHKQTPEGLFVSRTAQTIDWRYEDERKMYYLAEEVQELAEFLPHDVTVTGWVVRVGEETNDAERHTIRDRRCVTEKAIMRWPNGSEFKWGEY